MKALLPDLVLVHGPHIVVVMVTVVTMVTVVRLLEVAEVGCVDVGLGHGAGAVPGAGPRPLASFPLVFGMGWWSLALPPLTSRFQLAPNLAPHFRCNSYVPC